MSALEPASTVAAQEPSVRVGYVVKRYPRFSETFIVNEILAHEQAGADLAIFALRPGCDPRYQPAIAQVKAKVHYLRYEGVKAETLWQALLQCTADGGDTAQLLVDASAATATETLQAVELANAVRKQGIGHLHAHFGTSAATVARLAARLAGVPYTFTAHAKDIYHEEVDCDHLAAKIADAHSVVTVSDFNLRHLEEN
ncbi:MAG: hypothetical protein KDA61_16140, partial [Planctomycetales bacterium]|nr:hypothetical protein [Planctomycetales bacterium]